MKVIGKRLDTDYQILREIAKGALSRVFLVSDGQAVKAVKLFPARYAQRAEREYEYGHALKHPHLNPVEKTVSIDDYHGVIMPFVPGERLGNWLETHDQTSFLTTFTGVFKALEYLHAAGIIHRDLKPENILITRDDRAVLLDYDLAIYQHEAQRKAQLTGTVAFLSPEQANAQPATPQSDLYSAGVILYWALTKEVPFTGSVQEVLHAHRHTPVVPPSRLNAHLEPFDEMLLRLLAKDPAERYASATEVIAALKDILT